MKLRSPLTRRRTSRSGKSTGKSAYERASRKLNLGARLFGLWVALASFYVLQLSLDYRGIVARLAEWEFLHFDRYWPTLTFVALTLALSAPVAVLLWLLRLGRRRAERIDMTRLDERRAVTARLADLKNLFVGVALGSLLAAAISIVQMLVLPNDRLTPRSIVIGSPDDFSPPDGRAVLTGLVDLGETAQFNETLLLARRTLYFAPIRSGRDDKRPLRYFVEVRREDVHDAYDRIPFPTGDDRIHIWRFHIPGIAFTPYTDGVLRRNALPGEIANAYRYAGHKVDRTNFVLFHSNAPIRWRYLVLAGEFAVAATLAGLVALWFARRKRRIAKLPLTGEPPASSRRARRAGAAIGAAGE